MPRVTKNRRRADRIRAAICVCLLDAQRPLRVAELVAAITALGIDLGSQPNKTVADAVRWEIRRRHVRRVGRGTYALDTLPPSTAYYMRRRVEVYVVDPTIDCSRPDNHLRLP